MTSGEASRCASTARRASKHLRVIQIVSGLEASDGGTCYSIPRLSVALRSAGVDSRLFQDLPAGVASFDEMEGTRSFSRQFEVVPGLRKLQISVGLSRALLDDEVGCDLIHNHGLWRMANVYGGRAAERRSVPMIVSPRGMLSEVALRFSRHTKAVFWFLWQSGAIERSRCLHATSLSEFADIRRLGITKPVAIIPNGVDLPNIALSGDVRLSPARTLLYLGRLHPIKGLEALIAAWSEVEDEFPDWSLRIVGPGEPMHVRQLDNLISRLGVRRASREGAVSGEMKWRLFTEADLFVLPSYSENFGITVSESLACRRPVIVTKAAPWAGVEAHGCGWWIDTGNEALTAALRVALGTPREVLDAMGARGEVWVKRQFSWESIGEDMAKVYLWLCRGHKRPETVQVD